MATFLKTWPLGCENSQGKPKARHTSLPINQKAQKKAKKIPRGGCWDICVVSVQCTQLSTIISWPLL